MFIPVEAVANNGGGVTVCGVVHRQVQRHNAVAASRIGERVRQVIAGLRNASMFVPVEAVAGKGDGVAIVGIVHRQVQRHDAVAAGRIGECVRQVIARQCKSRVFIPVKAVAGDGDGVAIVGVIHCQVQGHHRITTTGIHERLRIVAGLCIDTTIPNIVITGVNCEINCLIDTS